MPGCPFCNPDPESVVVYRAELVYAMVSRRPINKFHLMVIPNEHVEQFTELPDAVVARLFIVAKRLSQAVREVAKPDMITHLSDDDLAGVGLNLVAHYKLHIIPRYRDDQVRIDWNRQPDPGENERAGYAKSLREAIANNGRI